MHQISALHSLALFRFLLAVALTGAVSTAQAHSVPDTMAQRTQACVVCHGKEGRATSDGYFPRIAGKPAGYLYNQLLNIRDGRRNNRAMAHLIENLSDAYLQEIAVYFSALDLPYAPPQTAGASPTDLARGEALVKQGDAARGLPACVKCHGAAMTGVVPAIPGLLGLPRDYLLGQIGSWQTGQRHAQAPDCMAQIARRLSPQDVGAVAAWLSSQPVSGGPAPAGSITRPLPLDCGSAP